MASRLTSKEVQLVLAFVAQIREIPTVDWSTIGIQVNIKVARSARRAFNTALAKLKAEDAVAGPSTNDGGAVAATPTNAGGASSSTPTKAGIKNANEEDDEVVDITAVTPNSNPLKKARTRKVGPDNKPRNAGASKTPVKEKKGKLAEVQKDPTGPMIKQEDGQEIGHNTLSTLGKRIAPQISTQAISSNQTRKQHQIEISSQSNTTKTQPSIALLCHGFSAKKSH